METIKSKNVWVNSNQKPKNVNILVFFSVFGKVQVGRECDKPVCLLMNEVESLFFLICRLSRRKRSQGSSPNGCRIVSSLSKRLLRWPTRYIFFGLLKERLGTLLRYKHIGIKESVKNSKPSHSFSFPLAYMKLTRLIYCLVDDLYIIHVLFSQMYSMLADYVIGSLQLLCTYNNKQFSCDHDIVYSIAMHSILRL